MDVLAIKGDLQKFMEVFQTSASGYPIDIIQNGTVHVVTHSQIMQKYFAKTLNTNLENAIPILHQSNCWSFKQDKDVSVLASVNMWAGVPSNKVKNKGNENIDFLGDKIKKGLEQSITCGLTGSTGTKLTCKGEEQHHSEDDDDDDKSQDQKQVVNTGEEIETYRNSFANNFGYGIKSQGGKRSKKRMGKKGKTRKIKKGKKTRKLRRRK